MLLAPWSDNRNYQCNMMITFPKFLIMKALIIETNTNINIPITMLMKIWTIAREINPIQECNWITQERIIFIKVDNLVIVKIWICRGHIWRNHRDMQAKLVTESIKIIMLLIDMTNKSKIEHLIDYSSNLKMFQSLIITSIKSCQMSIEIKWLQLIQGHTITLIRIYMIDIITVQKETK